MSSIKISWNMNIKWATAQQNQQNDVCPDQPGHQSSISVWRGLESVAVLRVHSEDWSDWMDAQADLSLRWVHIILLVLSCSDSNESAGCQSRADICQKLTRLESFARPAEFFADLIKGKQVSQAVEMQNIWSSTNESVARPVYALPSLVSRSYS